MTKQNNGRFYLGLACAVLAAAVVASGCSSKKKNAGTADMDMGAASGIGEEGLAGQSSLSQFEQGGGAVQGGGIYRDIQFGYDSYAVDGVGLDALRHNAQVLQGDPARRVEIEGHCDERGASEY